FECPDQRTVPEGPSDEFATVAGRRTAPPGTAEPRDPAWTAPPLPPPSFEPPARAVAPAPAPTYLGPADGVINLTDLARPPPMQSGIVSRVTSVDPPGYPVHTTSPSHQVPVAHGQRPRPKPRITVQPSGDPRRVVVAVVAVALALTVTA